MNYGYNGNQLLYVDDATGNPEGFTDDYAGTEYFFDANGNMITDVNKGITNITYNHLNLPEVITLSGGTIIFLYDANGNKLRKTVSNGTSQDYLGGIEYNGGVIEAIYHEEGRATLQGSTWQYEYYLKDHLGNTRVIFSDTNNDGEPEILQEADYYPFGMRHDRSITATNHYLYNGKELNEDLGLDWYDYGARWVDVETGRWSSIDPLAEKFDSWSGYHYAYNNPILFVDKDGREPRWGQLANLNEIMTEVNNALVNFEDAERPFSVRHIYLLSHNEYNLKRQFGILRDHFRQNTRYNRNEDGDLIQTNRNVDRYIYTTSNGWVDMHHFFYFAEDWIARDAIDYGDNGGQSIKSYSGEIVQRSTLSPSGFSYEDLVSNRLGIQFARRYTEQISKGDIKVEDALRIYLSDLGAVEPEQAPNFEFIPHIANNNTVRVISGKPLTGVQLRNAHRSVHQNRPQAEQNNIREAHEQFRR